MSLALPDRNDCAEEGVIAWPSWVFSCLSSPSTVCVRCAWSAWIVSNTRAEAASGAKEAACERS